MNTHWFAQCGPMILFKPNQLVFEAVMTIMNDQVGWWGYMGRVIWV